jgi:signal transduction histidine kinase/ligand-binding sensor domain-containing protein/CheY-like chemotaxis protein
MSDCAGTSTRLGGLRAILLSLIETLVLLHLGACFAGAQKSINGLVKPPVIDRNDIRFVRLSVNGEPLQSWITNVVQDDDGFLWLGTSDGLYKYDGYVLKPYRHERGNPNSVSDDSIAAVYKDRDGSLWIGSSYGGLDKLDPDHDTFTHYHHESTQPKSLANNNVNCVYRDHSGELWVCTADGLDRLKEASGTFIHYRHSPQDASSLSNNTVVSVYEDHRGNLWVGTTVGLNRFDRTTGRFTRFLHDPANPHSIGNNYIGSILEDRSGVLWVTSPMGSGLSALNLNTGEFTRYSSHQEEPSSQSVAGVNRIFEDRDGALWVCTVDRGLLKLDRERKTFTRYSNHPGDPNSLPNDSVQSMLEDAEGELWAGTVSGLARFQRAQPSFVNYRHEPHDPNSLHNGMIWSTLADDRGFLWIGDEDGLNRLDRRTGQFSFYQHHFNDPHSLSYNKVAAIREDPSGTLWFGTYGGGLDRFDSKTGQFFTYRHRPKDPGSLSSDAVLSLLIDRQGTLWVGTQGGGLDRFDKATGRFTTYLNEPANPALPILDLYEDRAGMLWVGTAGQGLFRFDPRTKQVTSYRHNSDDPRSLSSDKVNVIREDPQGHLWVGSADGLNLLDRSHGTFTTLTTSDGLPDNAIESILEDGHGFLWLGTHNGISRFDPRRKTFRNYFESDGLPGNLLDPHGARGSCRTPDGELVFGSSRGVTVFYPDRISDNPYTPPVRLTDLLLFNKPVRPGRGSPLSKSIWATDAFTLKHNQSIFTVEFASLSYVAPEKNRFRYRLEGLETRWNEVDSSRRSATYTNLAAGNYLFRVQGSNNDGVWNTRGVTLAITVLPPWWATWWFRSMGMLLLAGTIWVIYRSRVKTLQLQTARLELEVAQRTHELQIAKNIAETAKDAAERANQSKTTFLANMSHELRTPLNAILGFSDLLREGVLSARQRHDLDIVNRSGEHLLNLINNVLDMAKIDTGRVVIENAPVDLADLVTGVRDLMRLRAEEKGLELSVEQSLEFCQFVQADGEKLREVLINLVGNAVKFTERGKIILRVDGKPAEDSRYCTLIMEVQDTGIGIAGDDQARIFEPFMQAGKSPTRKGTGLGLAISKKYIDLMGGTIRVESAPGEGSLFHIEVPALKIENFEPSGSEVRLGRVIGLAPGQPAYRILIVEDQEENWLLLQRLLENAGFQLQVAVDGETAIGKFRAWRPHFIWMDWGLSGIDGLEVARRIRQFEGGREVKIAMLSGFAFTEYRASALLAGVDDFVTKPFQPREIFDCLARQLGVRYVYQAPANAEIAGVFIQETLADLPEDLRKELTDAVTSLDLERIGIVITRISEQNQPLGQALSRYAERYEFSQILQAL